MKTLIAVEEHMFSFRTVITYLANSYHKRSYAQSHSTLSYS